MYHAWLIREDPSRYMHCASLAWTDSSRTGPTSVDNLVSAAAKNVPLLQVSKVVFENRTMVRVLPLLVIRSVSAADLGQVITK